MATVDQAVQRQEGAQCDPKAREREHSIPLSAINPDTDGDGKVTKEEQRIYDALVQADVSKDGNLSVSEMYSALSRFAALDRKREQYKRFGVVVTFVLLLVIASTLATSLAAAFIAKDSKASNVGGGSALTGVSGVDILQTAPALYPVPLIVAPVLPLETIAKVESLSVSYNGIGGEKAQARFLVSGFERLNNTYITFESMMSRVKEVRVWNGETTVLLGDGSVQSICAGEITCSALHVEDATAAQAQEADAIQALEAAGFSPQHTSGRALSWNCW